MKLLKPFTLISLIASVFILESCQEDEPNPCPDVLFTIDIDSTDYSYTITAEGIENLVYAWFVNDHIVDSVGIGDSIDHTFDFELVPGTYEVCIKAESIDCNKILEFCQEVIIPDASDRNCLGLEFDFEKRSDHLFEFTAAFEGINDLEYTWYVDGDSLKTESLGSDRTHLLEREFDGGIHSICIVAYSETCGLVEFCKEIYAGEGDCPALHFETEKMEDNKYLFVADFAGKEEVQYKWFIGDEIVDVENFEGQLTDHKLKWTFEPGEYYVCIVVETDRCEEVVFCEEISVPRASCPAPDLFFEIEFTSDSTHLFVAEFPDMDSTRYKWQINGDIVDKENYEGYDTDHQLIWDFYPGYYKVCLVVYNEGCEPVKYCREIEIDGYCPQELSFRHEQENDHSYLFVAEFEGKEHVPYKWFIGDEIVDKENFEGYDTDHKLFWQFGSGTYLVCIVSFAEGCEEVEYCEEIVIDRPCPTELFFRSEQEAHNAYYFFADFEGMEHAQYKWYIDDEIVDKENFDGYDTDHKLLWDFEPGTYNVCIVLDTEGCETVEYCEQLTVEQFCPAELFFHSEEEADSAYIFYADFEGMELTPYKWYINDEIVDMENFDGSDTDHKLIWDDFEPGIYTVCIVSMVDGCETVEYCEEIEITPPCIEDISFTGVKDESSNTYTFSVDFEGKDDVTYILSIYVSDDLQQSFVREAGSTDGHDFQWDFVPGTVYEVCLRQDGGCGDFQVCQEFVIQ